LRDRPKDNQQTLMPAVGEMCVTKCGIGEIKQLYQILVAARSANCREGRAIEFRMQRFIGASTGVNVT
jgi:hypothetical protein